MTHFAPADTLHRLIKEVLDSGDATSLAEAERIFQRYRVGFEVGDAEVQDPAHQAMLLTGVALARRVFLGGASVSGPLAVPLKVPLPLGETLQDAVEALGGSVGNAAPNTPTIVIGGQPRKKSAGFQVRAVCAGWRGGIVPGHAEVRPAGAGAMPLAAMLAAALAVNEAFFFLRSGSSAAGRRALGLSLWQPGAMAWLEEPGDEPAVRYLPSRLWLIGLGHLGQAYLWGLGLLPYSEASALSLVLQDVDIITPSTESTSILTDATLIGLKKTRAMAAWAERRGFSTAIHERLFSADFQRYPDEPAVALCGLDNALGRRALDQVGFDFVVEAGLGRGHRDFRTMRLHTLPSPKPAREIWTSAGPSEEVEARAGYQKLLADGVLDRCGVTLLAGKAVGAPFVGAVASSLALAEVLRLLHGGVIHQVIDLDLLGTEYLSAVPHPHDFSRLNPGYALAK